MPNDAHLIDAFNLRIVEELQADGRLSVAELGRRVGLSPPAVAERLQRLEREGVITGYHAEVNPRALGLALSAVIRIRPAPGQLENVARLAQTTTSIVQSSPVPRRGINVGAGLGEVRALRSAS